ncbi:MAG: hypothetical protein K2W96_24715 [Gemmataceae bacterium]|nr:hypothetical protein [Gemmataceae bacterium]
MTRVSLDGMEAAVREFALGMATDPSGTILEYGGRPVAWVVPAKAEPAQAGPWTEQKNERRCGLIKRQIADGLSPEETVELASLQEEMLRYRQQVAPLPLETARRLHQELLDKATGS